MRGLTLVALALVPLVARAGVLENASQVGGVSAAGANTTSLAFGFQATASRSVGSISVYVKKFPGHSRTFLLGIRGGTAGGPGTAWLGTAATVSAATPDAWNTYTLPAPAPLTAGSIYYVVLEPLSGGTAGGSFDLLTTSPAVGRNPLTQQATLRTVWEDGPSWAKDVGLEPVFLLDGDDADAWAVPSCSLSKAVEGNPYYQAAMANITSTNPATQSFHAQTTDGWIRGVEVPLAAVTGTIGWEVRCDAPDAGSSASSGTLSAIPDAGGPSASNWYSGFSSLAAIPEGASCTLKLSATSGSSASWVGAAGGVSTDPCGPAARASFHGARGFLIGSGVVGVATDAIFRVHTCGVDCPDAGPVAPDASSPAGVDSGTVAIDDAGTPPLDGALAPDASAAAPDAAAVDAGSEEVDASAQPIDASTEFADSSVPADASGEGAPDVGAIASVDGSVSADAGDELAPDPTSVYGCGCRSAGGLLPLAMVVLAFRPGRRKARA